MTRDTIDDLKNALLVFDKPRAAGIIQSCITRSGGIEQAHQLITATLEEFGEEWSKGLLSLAQEYMAASICESIIEQINPVRTKNIVMQHDIAITTIDDFHLLGKKIVVSVLESSGIHLMEHKPTGNIGTLADMIIKNNNKIVLVSALMLHTAHKIAELKNILEKRHHDVKIIVGGAPFIYDSGLWQHVGADAMGTSPTDAIPFINQWRGEMST